MALFKIEKGLKDNLSLNRPITQEGWCYFTIDDGKFYIDIESGKNVKNSPQSRICLNANVADVAKKLDVVDTGNSGTPVYFANGIPVPCTDIQHKIEDIIGLETALDTKANADDYLPLQAGEAYKLSGPLGLTNNVMYGNELPEEGFEGQLFFLIENESPLYMSKDNAAVWNDYAEFRSQKEEIKPGYCVASADNGQVYKTNERFQACDGIVSDTFGFAIGETDECKTPLAVAGRVLAYCEGNRYDYHSGDTVCAGPDGKVCKMTREEIREWPDRIIGIVSEIPEYEIWGDGNVPVNGRIWIKIK